MAIGRRVRTYISLSPGHDAALKDRAIKNHRTVPDQIRRYIQDGLSCDAKVERLRAEKQSRELSHLRASIHAAVNQ